MQSLADQQTVTLRPPRPDEAKALTALCRRSKAVWGYDDAFMRACAQELEISAKDIAATAMQVAAVDHRLIGVVQIGIEGDEAELAKLFVDPGAQRSGAGRALFAWAIATARAAGAQVMTIDSDPGAADFYRRLGAADAGVIPSGSIPGRMLPRLIVDLRSNLDPPKPGDALSGAGGA